jgi:hypothetical protein
MIIAENLKARFYTVPEPTKFLNRETHREAPPVMGVKKCV